MQNSPSRFTNMQFSALVASIRQTMPILAIVLLVTVYAISGAVSGKFLGSPTLLNNAVLGYFVGFAIQATRALLVFFRQLNPVRPTLGYQGEAIAAIMGAISIYEIYNLSSAAGMGSAVAFSLGVLMLAGIGIEIFLLSELRFHTELELFKDREYWHEIERYYQAKADFQAKIRALKSGQRIDTYTPQATTTRKATTNNTERMEDVAVPFSMNGHTNGHRILK